MRLLTGEILALETDVSHEGQKDQQRGPRANRRQNEEENQSQDQTADKVGEQTTQLAGGAGPSRIRAKCQEYALEEFQSEWAVDGRVQGSLAIGGADVDATRSFAFERSARIHHAEVDRAPVLLFEFLDA